MFIGYDMFRNLAQGKNMKKKQQKNDFRKFLLDPGMCVGDRVSMSENFCSVCRFLPALMSQPYCYSVPLYINSDRH